MRPEALVLEVRPRSPGEAIDLGARLVQTRRAAVTVAVLAVMLPVMVAAVALDQLSESRPGMWWTTLLWWFKPVCDRAALHVLALGVFGESVRLPALLRRLPRLIGPFLVGDLTWRRLSAVRSFAMPIQQLEGTRGAAARARRRLLLRGWTGPALQLMFACQTLELALVLAFSFGLLQLLPVQMLPPVDWSPRMFIQGGWIGELCQLGYAGAVLMVEPLYVAAGFTLYLARRTEIEAWDVELAFRRLALRLRPVGAELV